MRSSRFVRWLVVVGLVMIVVPSIFMGIDYYRAKRMYLEPKMFQAVVISLPAEELNREDQKAYTVTRDEGLLTATAELHSDYTVQPIVHGSHDPVWKIVKQSEIAEKVARLHFFLQFDHC